MRQFALSLFGLAWLAALPAALGAQQASVDPAGLDTVGRIEFAGRPTDYRIRHLPVSSFPELPPVLAAELEHRGCMVPQTWQAHHPENVIVASLSGPGAHDWALLCSAAGRVELLVAFNGDPASLLALAAFSETARLGPTHPGQPLGFDWGIDPASPAQVRQAQAGLSPRPAALDHDALADSTVERRTVYRYFIHGVWTRLPSAD